MITIYMYDEFGTNNLKMFIPKYSDTAKKIGSSVRDSGEKEVVIDFDNMEFCAKSFFLELILFELVNKEVKFINLNKVILNNALTAIKEIDSPPLIWVAIDNNMLMIEYMDV